MNEDTRGTVFRDRSKGNCTYYQLVGLERFPYKRVRPIVSLTNADSNTSIHFYNQAETMMIDIRGVHAHPVSDMMEDVMETLSKIKTDVMMRRGEI